MLEGVDLRWFATERSAVLAGLLVVGASMAGGIWLARRGRRAKIRPLPGLEAVREALGAAAELDRPVLYTSGVGDVRAPGVLASLGVLGWVAEEAAHHGCTLLYPVNNALNLALGRQVIHDGYVRAHCPEDYRDERAFFLSAQQFDYAAAVCGLIERERTAAHLFIGSFWSEALLMAETGASTGAIQIAATDIEHQIPFFVATCDHVLIGEELYAASAFLTQDPEALGSLQGQDAVKLALIALLVLGVLWNTLAAIGTLPEIDFDRFALGMER